MGKGFHQSGWTVRKGVVQFPPRYPRSRRRVPERFLRKAGLRNLIQRFSENAIAHEVGHSAARLAAPSIVDWTYHPELWMHLGLAAASSRDSS